MTKESEILLEAGSKGCFVVEKDSHVLWDRGEILEAQRAGRFQEEDRFLPPDEQSDVSGPYPGCMQLAAATGDDLDFRMLGQTRHFVIFFPAKGTVPQLG